MTADTATDPVPPGVPVVTSRPVRAVPVREAALDRSGAEPDAGRSVVRRPRQLARQEADIAVFDAPYRRPPTTVPAPEPPMPAATQPAPIAPLPVVVRASAPAADEPAFWERRQLGRLHKRILR